MTALTSDRLTPERAGVDYAEPVAAGARIYAGALVVLNAADFAAPGSTATGLRARGIAQESVDNSGGLDGDLTVRLKRGVFRLANDGTVTRADIGSQAWIVDDQTVANNSATNTRSAAGTIRDVDADGVWVEI